jgi:CubicO group peptidase (beta-lactamase class C family)
MPEEAGVKSEELLHIDEIVKTAIAKGAMPGCQVLVAKSGMVIYDKAFGAFDYSGNHPVKTTDLYDLASCTKITATTMAAMYMVEQGKIDLEKTVKDYLTLPANNTIGNIKLRDLMLHEAGLTPFIPFYKKSMESDEARMANYRYESTPGFSLAVANKLFIRDDYPETIWNTIATAEISHERKFVYSDLSMYIMRRIIEQQAGMPFDKFVNAAFYGPMGLQRTMFKPAEQFPITDIAPTENDQLFRQQQIQGYVHDPGAAMMGGVSGHAGLFANADDLAALFQMTLNGGEYAGLQFLNKNTIDQFTKKQSSISRRGYGFDKPEPDKNKTNPCASETPLSTYGHTGFTGTCIWVDPDNQLIYIFLSNRVYPNAENWKLVSLGVRSDIQSAIYAAIRKN